MKKIILLGVVLSLLTGCEDDDRKSPEGIITKSVKALYNKKAKDFLGTLTGPARQKFANADQQKVLLNSLGNIKKIKYGATKTVTSTGDSSNSNTVYETPVMRDGQILYIVSTVCNRQTWTDSHLVCPSEPSPGDGGGGWDPGDSGGGLTPGPSNPKDDDGGGLTPGPSNPGGPGGGDDRPPRYPGMYAESSDCYTDYTTRSSTSCLVQDVR